MKQNKNNAKTPKDKSEIISNVIIGCIIAAFLGLGGYAVGSKIVNDRKNAPADDVQSEQTVETLKTAAEAKNMSVSDYLAEYGLPSDLSDTTPMTDIYSQMTLENLAKVNDKTVDEFRSENFVPDDISNDTAWEDVIPKLPFKAVVGEEQIAQFKSVYGLDDSITAETPWGEVEPILMQKQEELNAAMANANNADSTADDADKDSDIKTEE